MTTSKFAKIVMGAVLLTGILTQAQAQDKKVDPSGTYMWTQPGRNGGPDRTNTLVLKLDGDTLSGNLASPGRDGQIVDIKIGEAQLAGTNISFIVTREFNGNTFTNKYSGLLTDGAIKGKMEFTRNGDTQSRDWEAKKQAAKK